MTEREAVTSALAGPAREGARDVGRRRALRADARQQQHRLRQEPPRLADRARDGRADDGADAREAALADEIRAPLLDELGDVLPQRPAVRERQLLHVACARVRGPHEAEDARAVQAAGLQERLDRVAAEIGVDGERVRERRLARRAARGTRRRTRARSSRCRRACRPRSRAARRRGRRRRRARAPRSRRPRAPRRRPICGLTATT